MDGNEGTRASAQKRSAAKVAGVTATAIALGAVAIFIGARRAGDAGVPGAPLAAAAPSAPPAAAVAVAEPRAESPPLPARHPPRRLEQVNRRELTGTLPKGVPIDVTANDGDPEAFQLAQQIRGFLRANGYQAGDVTRSVSTPPAKGVGLQPLADGRWRVIVGSAED
jgi:hypothetical protein